MKIKSFVMKDGELLLSVDDWGVRAAIKGLKELSEKNYGGFIRLEMSPPYKPRTTGLNSQNNLIWKLITEIAKETGNELQDVEDAAKMQAIKMGYPYKQNKITGQVKPLSMTEIDTQQAGFLIDELYAIAAEYNVDLKE